MCQDESVDDANFVVALLPTTMDRIRVAQEMGDCVIGREAAPRRRGDNKRVVSQM